MGLGSHQVALQPLPLRRLPRENESSEEVGHPGTLSLGLCQLLLPQALLDATLLPPLLPPTSRWHPGGPPDLLTRPGKVPPRQIPAICSLHSPSPTTPPRRPGAAALTCPRLLAPSLSPHASSPRGRPSPSPVPGPSCAISWPGTAYSTHSSPSSMSYRLQPYGLRQLGPHLEEGGGI